MTSNQPARGTDLFDFQGLRKRLLVAPDYSPHDSRFALDEEPKPIENEYEHLDLTGEQFERLVRPTVGQSSWIADRQHIRTEVNRLGDLVDFYDHKPRLNDLEKRIYKRITRQDRAIQTDEILDRPSRVRKQYQRVPVIRLPPPLAMERVEQFLAENHWRLVDLFRRLDKKKSWKLVKEDFMQLVEEEQLNISEAQAEELITCFCREVQVPMDYKKFARGRSLYKKSIRDSLNQTPSSVDTQLETDSSTTHSSSYLQAPLSDTSHRYPPRESSSSYSRSTVSSVAKYKRSSHSTDSKLSAYQ